MTSEQYVRELARRLPFALGVRRRVLAEVREHLRDGREDAVARFGSVDELAEQLAPELRTRAAARASLLAPLLVVLFLVPFYVVPENTLPPAPWAAKPAHLAWKQDVAVYALLVAGAFALAAFLLGRFRPRLVFVALGAAVVGLAVAATFGAIAAVQWIGAVPGTSAPITYSCLAASFALLFAATFLAIESSPHGRRELTTD
jgi:HAAS